MLPVGIHGGGDRLEIIRGDAFYQSYICHLPRSVIELAQSGRLDLLSAVLFPSTCDVIRNLSGVWKLLYPETLRPLSRSAAGARIARSGADFWREELRRSSARPRRGLGIARRPTSALREAIARVQRGPRAHPRALPGAARDARGTCRPRSCTS